MPLTVGLTGGVASGKTAAGEAFAGLGVPLLDGDQVARDVVAPGQPALEEIFSTFGTAFRLPDGTLDRRKMREHVFADAAERRRLEEITHPHIRRRLLQWRDAQSAPYCILSVAILLESGMGALVDRVLVVDAPEELQLQRLRQRDGIDDALASAMLAAQAPREERLAHADDVLRNEGSLEELRKAVATLHAFYLRLAEDGTPSASGLHLP